MITLTARLKRIDDRPDDLTDEALADLKADIIEVVNGRGWLIDITAHCGDCPHPPHQGQCGITTSTFYEDIDTDVVTSTCRCVS